MRRYSNVNNSKSCLHNEEQLREECTIFLKNVLSLGIFAFFDFYFIFLDTSTNVQFISKSLKLLFLHEMAIAVNQW